jgi:hypothetical protein
MTHTPPTVTDALCARLLAAIGAPALVELTAYVAVANLYSRTDIAFGIESQGFAASCELRPLPEPAAPGAHRGESRCVGRARAPSVAG